MALCSLHPEAPLSRSVPGWRSMIDWRSLVPAVLRARTKIIAMGCMPLKFLPLAGVCAGVMPYSRGRKSGRRPCSMRQAMLSLRPHAITSRSSSPLETGTQGRIIALNQEGEEELSRDLEAAAIGRLATAPGVAVAVTLTGEVTQLGTASRLQGPVGGQGSVRVLSWRQR